MFQFFVTRENQTGNEFRIYDEDFHHMSQVIRIKEQEKIRVSLLDDEKHSFLCKLKQYEQDCAVVEIIEMESNFGEVNGSIVLFQGLPKSDKMEWIIQKAVELGVTEIVPVSMEHSVVKLDEKKAMGKVQRWQTISLNAAKQSKRSKVPTVQRVMSFKEAMEYAKSLDQVCLPYENQQGVTGTTNFLNQITASQNIGIFIGPEGGFSKKEIEQLPDGIVKISLGRRILRTETAAIFMVGLIMMQFETLDETESNR